ncbi:beta subunit of N-acylethanolamine-hydrolyzing acid amidase-domain-containing protein [Xylaria nigripes]|nr:beta subunit of N-acylethanolamine-hydrolyzing acid amidase-domain-containing protein [Xylaria nigripes]
MYVSAIMSTPQTSHDPIPAFTIDLARAPRERYHEVVRALGPRMRSLVGLYDDLLALFIASTWLRFIVVGLSKLCLRRVYDDEENEEIKGIAAASGVPLYLLVALNNLLDCLLGCTSGAMPVSFARETDDAEQPRLVHFRTLDWGMDGLRDLLVVLEFVDSSSGTPTKVIARSITYAGFVGALTAVRPGLSISLNQRIIHDCPTRQLRRHQLLVLLGKRKSIGSIVRSLILRDPQFPEKPDDVADGQTSRLAKQAVGLALIPSAPCYLILCDGEEALVIAKDHIRGTIRTARGFIVQTNHDLDNDGNLAAQKEEISPGVQREVITSSFGVEGWVEESAERLQCLQERWDRFVRSKTDDTTGSNVDEPSITERRLCRWMSDYPILNECSHFATILDPVTGKIRWLVRGPVEGCA